MARKTKKELMYPINYEELRLQAMEFISSYSHQNWTDYNSHDPGITMMEVLCFALTELGYRANLPVKDLIATVLNKGESGFYPNHQILTNAPLTINDYRKIVIDIDGVRNAWISEIEGYHSPVYVNKKKTSLASRLEKRFIFRCTDFNYTDRFTKSDCAKAAHKSRKLLEEFLDKTFYRQDILVTRIDFRDIFKRYPFLKRLTLEFMGGAQELIVAKDGNKIKIIKNDLPTVHQFEDYFEYSFPTQIQSSCTFEINTINISPEERKNLSDLRNSLASKDISDILSLDFYGIFFKYDRLKSLTFTYDDFVTLSSGEKQDGFLKVALDVNGQMVLSTHEDCVITCRGYYRIDVELEEGFPKECYDDKLYEVKQVVNQRRNLCELFPVINIVDVEYVYLCLDVELSLEADVEDTLSNLTYKLNKFIDPSIYFYSLSQMKEKINKDTKENYRIEDIFNGPLLHNGFIDNEELDKAQPREFLYGSDLIQEMMDVEGVVAVNKLLMSSYFKDDDSTLYGGEENQQWKLPLDTTKATKLLITYSDKNGKRSASKIKAYKNRLPYQVNSEKLFHDVNLLKVEEMPLPFTQEDLTEPLPKGESMSLESYYTIRNHFPSVYALKDGELPNSADKSRKAKVLQLRAFLLFFDQLLANSFSQLANLGNVLSYKTVDHTYFTQLTEAQEDLETLLSISPEEYLAKVQSITESEGLFDTRRNRFLNHLLTRFGEEFNDYAVIAKLVYGDESEDRLIADKERVLKNIVPWGALRGLAENILLKEMSPLNVSGLEYRLRTFLGMKSRELSSENEDEKLFIEILNQSNVQYHNDETYSFSLSNKTGVLVNSSSFKEESTRDNTVKELFTFIQSIQANITSQQRKKYKNLIATLRENSSDDHSEIIEQIRTLLHDIELLQENPVEGQSYLLLDTIQDGNRWSFAITVKGLCECTLTSIKEYTEKESAEKNLYLAVDFILNIIFFDKMFVLEHLLFLLENSVHSQSLQTCEDSGPCGIDPYSFRITVVLPGENELLSNMEFRQYLEFRIREAVPSHIFPKICWVSNEQILQFEHSFTHWKSTYIDYLHKKVTSYCLDKARKELLDITESLESIYDEAILRGCSTIDTYRTPLILGSSKLGSLDGD